MADKYFSFLPMGKTGIGKSTFLNALFGTNQFVTSSSANSCTKNVFTHSFRVNDSIIMPIDAPGLYDSKGIEEDQRNMTGLINFLRSHKYGLNGIALVIGCSDYRLDSTIKKILKYLNQFIGNNNLWSHLCVIVTHSPPYPKDIQKLKESMTCGNNSLKAEMIRLIKGINQINYDPQIPFFFVDSMHPNYFPSNEYLPQFKKWLLSMSSLKTCNLSFPDINYQYKQHKSKVDTTYGQLYPIHKYERGPTKHYQVTEKYPVVVKKTGYRTKKKLVEYYVSRDVDAFDIFSFGLARAFRDNDEKRSYWKEYEEPYEYEVIEYRERKVTKSKPGDLLKVIKGYYQTVEKKTYSWMEYWDYEVDIIDKNNPTHKSSYDISTETSTYYFNEKRNRIFSSSLINELKELI